MLITINFGNINLHGYFFQVYIILIHKIKKKENHYLNTSKFWMNFGEISKTQQTIHKIYLKKHYFVKEYFILNNILNIKVK